MKMIFAILITIMSTYFVQPTRIVENGASFHIYFLDPSLKQTDFYFTGDAQFYRLGEEIVATCQIHPQSTFDPNDFELKKIENRYVSDVYSKQHTITVQGFTSNLVLIDSKLAKEMGQLKFIHEPKWKHMVGLEVEFKGYIQMGGFALVLVPNCDMPIVCKEIEE
jgi:hypothetical protein